MNRLIEIMLSRNLHEEAMIELPRMATKVAALEVDSGNAKQIYHCLKTQASNVGKRLDLSGLMDAVGNPYRPKAFDQNVKMLMFWSTNDEKSLASLTSMHRNIGAMQNLSVTPLAIFVDDGSSSQNEAEFQKHVKDLPRIDFYRVDRNTAKGKAFHENCPVPRFPFILLLDDQNRLHAINPEVKRLRSEIEKIASKISQAE